MTTDREEIVPGLDDVEVITEQQLAGLHEAEALLVSLHERAGPTPEPVLQEAITELETTLEGLSAALETIHELHAEVHRSRGQLESERRYFQDLFDLAPDAYLLTDAEGVIRGANRAALRMFATGADRLVGRQLASFVPPDERHDFRAQLHALDPSHGHQDWIFGIVPEGRGAITVTANVRPGQGPDGHATDLRWQLRDETHARQAQAHLQESFATAREEARNLRDIDRWKDAFIAAAAHDLRTPLAVISTATQTLRRGAELDPELRDHIVDRIDAQATRLKQLLDDLLDLDRFTRGAVTAQREPVNLHDLVAKTIAMLPTSSHPVNVEGVPVVAEVDPARVEQIVANLVGNAVKHTPMGTPIHVRTVPAEHRVTLVVEDEGPGLDPDLGERIFQPFVTQARHPGEALGTGLGLTLVALFAELHGGKVHAEDRPGGGARFVVDLPATIHDPDA